MSALPAPCACFHCGLAVLDASARAVLIEGVLQPMCCPGCAGVAEAIVAAGCSDYYRERSTFAANGAPATLVPPQLALYDAAPAAPGSGQDEIVLYIEGIRCAACVWLIERCAARVPGVLAVDMNVSTERLLVRWESALCKPSDIIKALRAVGYTAYPDDRTRHAEQRDLAGKKLFRQLFVAGLCMMQVMMYALPAYIADDGSIDADMAALLRWASLLLTLPAMLYSAQPFLAGAWAGLRRGMPGMDVPVVLGLGAAFGASVLATVRASGEVYFDSVTMFIFLLLASRYLEAQARRKAGQALDRLQHGLPASASLMAQFPASRAQVLVAAGALAAGDVILVAPGESVAADGVLVDARCDIDLSLLTGESQAQTFAAGAEVPGGAVNAGQAFVLRVTQPAQDSTLARIAALAQRAGHGKPQLALWADRVAAWFVVALLLLTLLVFFIWQQIDPARAWQVAVAVLVVSCPCALSLATPSALAAATDALLRRGVLVVKPHVLETLQRATHIVFDKTGTLTQGKPVLRQLAPLGALAGRDCLAVAAALEESSLHPLAGAIRAAAGAHALQAHALHCEPGQGMEGWIGMTRYRLGRASFVAALSGQADLPPGPHDASCVYLGSEKGWLARLELADGLRPDAAAVVARFQAQGQQVILLSGDDPQLAGAVASWLGIAEAHGGQLPSDKLAFVQALQRRGAVVAMVGDGINDAAVLSAADVSFAMGSGAALAQVHADCVLLSARLGAVAEASHVAGAAMRVVRQNLAWASIYNALAIPAAACGLLSPWLSALGMSLSSALVVINSLRLRRAGG